MSYQLDFNLFAFPTTNTPTPPPNEIDSQPKEDFQDTIFLTENPTPVDPIRLQNPAPQPQTNDNDFRTNPANADFLPLPIADDFLNTDKYLAMPTNNNPNQGYVNFEHMPNNSRPAERNHLARGGEVFTIDEAETLIDEEALFNDVMGPARNTIQIPLSPVRNTIQNPLPARNAINNPLMPFTIMRNFQRSIPQKRSQEQKNYPRYIVRQIIRYLVSRTLRWKTQALCDEWERSYEDTRRYYLDNIESFTSISKLKKSWDEDPVFREFSRWFLKEKAIRYMINEGKMSEDNILSYIRFKNHVLRKWLPPE